MKVPGEKKNEKTGFTIVELLTVMSIIILLISLLVPALTRVRRYAQFVKQKAQFHAIGVALDLFNSEQGAYPPSNDDFYPSSNTALAYCGAMKLGEAMVGRDLSGYNPNSRFRRDGTIDGTVGTRLYPPNPGTADPCYPTYVDNIKSRRMYLQLDNANATHISDIYTSAHLTGSKYPLPHDPCLVVLCDVYVRTMSTGNKTGMPILYYRADTSKMEHSCNTANPDTDLDKNIYNIHDNQKLVDIAPPWLPSSTPYVHPMAFGGPTPEGGSANPCKFYDETRNMKISPDAKPYRADSYIMISAGFDGEYGTSDDVFNFGE